MAVPPNPFGAPRTGLLARLRRQQLVDIAHAWKIDINRDAPRDDILPALEAAERQGVFTRPPVNPYYFEKARWNSDQLMDAKVRGGYCRVGREQFIPCPPVQGGWQGPDPDIIDMPEDQRPVRGNPRIHEFNDLRKAAKEIGVDGYMKMNIAELKEAVDGRREPAAAA